MPQASRSLKLFAALVALGLMSVPARAEIWDYSFKMWANDATFLEGDGRIESAARAVGVPVFLLSGGVLRTEYFMGGPGCNNHVATCTPQIDVRLPLTIKSVRWIDFSDGVNLQFETLQAPGLFSTISIPSGQMSTPFTLTPLAEVIAAPGPVTGAGLPVLVGFFAAWLWKRRSYGRSAL